MGAPPAVLIVVRHGARLDAADKQWHLTSPTPYDPPLTFGGWSQSRALGARIASILRSRETDDEEAENGVESVNPQHERRRRHKVIVHTSPFLRCVQTSIAISAGLAQSPGHSYPRPSSSHSVKTVQIQPSPRSRPTISTDSPRLAPIYEPSTSLPSEDGNSQDWRTHIKKSTIRVDAFLGEWLSPDYFELITPPPSSIMMVAGAKADLLRREDYNNLIHIRDITAQSAIAVKGFPGGWGSPVIAPEPSNDDASLSTMSNLGQALPRRDRTSSLSSVGSGGSRHSGKSLSKLSTANPTEHGVYQPPIPSYAISNSDAIPPGYVAHAKDACVDVDYQWDSMREPQSWGNGGEYGEEWSSMHKRFRKGLQQLVHWYRDHGDAETTEDCSRNHQDDEDTDLVIILVTHGAGCNALIGALTNQPVLLDVGMASLTMAVRKPTPKNTPASTPSSTPKAHSRAPSRTLTIPDEYEVKLVANTEHLRTSSNSTPSTSRTPSLTAMSTYRNRFGGDGTAAPFVERTNGEPSRSIPSSIGSIRRTVSVQGTPLSRTYTPSGRSGSISSIGLWSAPQPKDEEEKTQETGDDMVLNFSNNDAAESLPNLMGEPAPTDQNSKSPNSVAVEDDDSDGIAPLGGLWTSSRLRSEAEIVREIAPKRRWTVNEKSIA